MGCPARVISYESADGRLYSVVAKQYGAVFHLSVRITDCARAVCRDIGAELRYGIAKALRERLRDEALESWNTFLNPPTS